MNAKDKKKRYCLNVSSISRDTRESRILFGPRLRLELKEKIQVIELSGHHKNVMFPWAALRWTGLDRHLSLDVPTVEGPWRAGTAPLFFALSPHQLGSDAAEKIR